MLSNFGGKYPGKGLLGHVGTLFLILQSEEAGPAVQNFKPVTGEH